jgi:hypothetical protein
MITLTHLGLALGASGLSLRHDFWSHEALTLRMCSAGVVIALAARGVGLV